MSRNKMVMVMVLAIYVTIALQIPILHSWIQIVMALVTLVIIVELLPM